MGVDLRQCRPLCQGIGVQRDEHTGRQPWTSIRSLYRDGNPIKALAVKDKYCYGESRHPIKEFNRSWTRISTYLHALDQGILDTQTRVFHIHRLGYFGPLDQVFWINRQWHCDLPLLSDWACVIGHICSGDPTAGRDHCLQSQNPMSVDNDIYFIREWRCLEIYEYTKDNWLHQSGTNNLHSV